MLRLKGQNRGYFSFQSEQGNKTQPKLSSWIWVPQGEPLLDGHWSEATCRHLKAGTTLAWGNSQSLVKPKEVLPEKSNYKF